ncbi:MAG: hypothetical protein P0S95_02940 [Rhabdochlamydiaceae bacterium]|nr:hypothetical protein [Candidatus Amphrikana amoebophyrae]
MSIQGMGPNPTGGFDSAQISPVQQIQADLSKLENAASSIKTAVQNGSSPQIIEGFAQKIQEAYSLICTDMQALPGNQLVEDAFRALTQVDQGFCTASNAYGKAMPSPTSVDASLLSAAANNMAASAGELSAAITKYL